jgi:hypothetical protein
MLRRSLIRQSRIAHRLTFVGIVAFAAASFVSSSAAADQDCIAGARPKTEGAFTWCEPALCLSDAQCSSSEVCKPVPLCIEIGNVSPDAGKADAGGQRLAVTQTCAPDKTCPQNQTCSVLPKCISKAAAERMGLLSTAPSAAGSASAGSSGGDAKKSSCGCDVPGRSTGALPGALALALGLAVLTVRGTRRSRLRRRP